MNVAISDNSKHQDILARKLQQQFRACVNARRFFLQGEDIDMGEALYSGPGAKFTEAFYAGHKDYYPHHQEAEFFRQEIRSVEPILKDTRCLRIVGPGPVSHFRRAQGSVAKKEAHLMDLLLRLPGSQFEQTDYIDKSPQIAEDNVSPTQQQFAAAGRKGTVNKYVTDYLTASAEVNDMPNTTVISTGSLISNISGLDEGRFPDVQIRESLAAFRALAGSGPGAKVMLGYDSCQNGDLIHQSYDSPLFRAYIRNGISWLARECHGMSGLDPMKVHEYFDYAPEWHEGISAYRHKARVTKPLHLRFAAIPGTDLGEDEVYLVPGETRNVLNSVKPPVSRIIELANDVGLETIYLRRLQPGLAEHIFACVPPRMG